MPEKKDKTICLCCILRNESKVVERLLESTKKIISYVSICDTGSTDNTIELVKNWSDMNKIPYSIHEEKWINFGLNRSNSFLAAKRAFPDASYYLLLDGDMIMEVDPSFNVNDLNLDEYMIEQRNRGVNYHNTRLVSSKKLFRCVGATHEYWSCVEDSIKGKISTLIIQDMNDGGSRSDKHERDIRYLMEGMRRNVTSSHLLGRYCFYLGQTFQGVSKYKLSDFWYNKRIDYGGWDEEIFYSSMQLAENKLRRAKYDEALVLFFNAWNKRPIRSEPVLGLCKCFRELGMKIVARSYIETGKKIPTPADGLFLSAAAYDGSAFGEELKKLES